MAYYVVAAGGNLYSVGSNGTVSLLTMLSGVTLDSTRVARMALLGRNVLIVNAASRNLWVTPDNTVRAMTPVAPVSPPVLAAGSGATPGLTGAYVAAYTHLVIDPLTGALLAESDFSPRSASVSVTAQAINYSGVAASIESFVTHRRLYRTLADGETLFPWIDLDGNAQTSGGDDTADDTLSLLSAPTELGTPPGTTPGTRLLLICQWKNRLWAIGDVNIEQLRFSGNGQHYGWPATYGFDVPPLGDDIYGVTGLMPRRDELGVARRRYLFKILGSDPSNFELDQVKNGVGCFAPDSVVVIDDTAYFLGEDGVYAWGPDGVNCVSDGKTRAWFATDRYFNRAQYPNAFAKYNQTYGCYELHLSALGSSDVDRWVAYHIKSGNWYGIHKTNVTTPTFAGVIVDANNLSNPVLCGSDGYVYELNNPTSFLDHTTPIPYSWQSKYHDAKTPSITKQWGRLALVSKIWSAFGGLTISLRTGGFAATVGQTFTPDMRVGRQTLGMCGQGELCNVTFSGSTSSGQGVELYGYELPFAELGQRGPR